MELQIIQKKIFEIRGQKMMLDFHLAGLYEVETRALKQAVKRNADLFPEDFMFQITREELKNLTSQFVMSSTGWGGTRHLPYAFTEHRVTMLAIDYPYRRYAAEAGTWGRTAEQVILIRPVSQ